jgi:hypothetical protein
MSAGTLRRNRVALKEWAVACRRLAEGRQIVILRKGGIADASRGFRVEHREFFLFPTLFHQRESELVPEARDELAASAFDPAAVPIETYAAVEDSIWVAELDRLRGLEGKHCLTWEAVESRFWYRGVPGLWALAIRAYRLGHPISLKNTPAYEGCRSWVHLEEELPVEHAGPVVATAEFRSRLQGIQSLLK